LARKGWTDRIDQDRLRRAVKDQTGLPVMISYQHQRETAEP
jgi:hypothetical protein